MVNLHVQIKRDLAAHARTIKETLADGMQVSDTHVLLQVGYDCAKYVEAIKSLSGMEKKNLVRAILVDICPNDDVDQVIEFIVEHCIKSHKNSITPHSCLSAMCCFKRSS